MSETNFLNVYVVARLVAPIVSESVTRPGSLGPDYLMLGGEKLVEMRVTHYTRMQNCQ